MFIAKSILPALALTGLALPAFADPLPSWNDGAAKSAIIDFVESVTDPASEQFVPEADRIASFDNDGTLWAEQPLYFQGLYALDVLKAKAEADPSILDSDALKAAAAGDMDGVMAGGMEGLLSVLNVSHSGMTVEDFQDDAAAWVATATHPTKGMTYADMTYQPMLELLGYLRTKVFRPISSRAAGCISSAPSPKALMAFRPSRSSAPRATRSMKNWTASRC